VGAITHAIDVFFRQLGQVAWLPVLLALACQSAKMLARTRAWRNVLAAAYPDTAVPWRSVFGAYAAGAGVNAVLPARGGDLLKLFLVKRRIDGATYSTLGASLLVETIVDLLLSTLLLLWALGAHVLPGVRVVRHLPSVDWFWLFRHPRLAVVVVLGAIVGSFLLGLLAARRFAAFRQRVGQGLTIVRTPSRYVRRVALWQLVDWSLRLATIYFFLRAFHIPADLGNALRVQVTQSLSTILPLTPSGIGTEQALSVYVLAGQASRSALLSFSVGMEIMLTVWNVALAVAAIALMLRTLRWKRALADARAADTP
jgi:uncharacterized membrane protein YbhN (UPF0104 family)